MREKQRQAAKLSKVAPLSGDFGRPGLTSGLSQGSGFNGKSMHRRPVRESFDGLSGDPDSRGLANRVSNVGFDGGLESAEGNTDTETVSPAVLHKLPLQQMPGRPSSRSWWAGYG